MAKADIKTPEGISIKLDGTPDEIAAVLRQIKLEAKTSGQKGKIKQPNKEGRTTVPGLIDELRGENFFKKPKTLADVKQQFADLGHSYPRTALSGPLQSEVRRRRLRRFKENGKYVYAQ